MAAGYFGASFRLDDAGLLHGDDELRARAPAAKGPSSLPAWPGDLDAYVGEYERNPDSHLIVTKEGELLRVKDSGAPFGVTLHADAPDSFFARSGDCRVTFLRDGSGNVEAIAMRSPGGLVTAKRSK